MNNIRFENTQSYTNEQFKKKSFVQNQKPPSQDQNNLSRSDQGSKKNNKLIEKPQQTIEVLSDEEEKEIIKIIFEEEYFRTKIQQAKLTKSKFIILKTLYTEIYFSNCRNDEKTKKFNSMLKGFISKHLRTAKGDPFDMRSSFFLQKLTVKQDDEFVENEYILYGTDLLSQKQIEKMFQKQKPSIKWIDASHCKLTFMQKISGWQCVVENSLNLQTLEKDLSNNTKVQDLLGNLDIQEEKQEKSVESKYNQAYLKLQKFKKSFHLLRDYVDLTHYYEMDCRRRLMIRNATRKEQMIGYNITQNQQNQQGQQIKQQSEYKKYLTVKEQFLNSLQNNTLVKTKYQQIQEQLQKQQFIIRLKGRYGKKPYEFNHKKSYQNQSNFYHNHANHSQIDFSHKNNPSQYHYQQKYQNQYEYSGNGYRYDRNRSRDIYQYQNNIQRKHRDGYDYQNNNNRKYDYHNNNNNNNSFRQNKRTFRGGKGRKQHNIEMSFQNYIQQRDGVAMMSSYQQQQYQYHLSYQNNPNNQYYYFNQYGQLNNGNFRGCGQFSRGCGQFSRNGSESYSNYEYNPKQNYQKYGQKNQFKQYHQTNEQNFQQQIHSRQQQSQKQQKNQFQNKNKVNKSQNNSILEEKFQIHDRYTNQNDRTLQSSFLDLPHEQSDNQLSKQQPNLQQILAQCHNEKQLSIISGNLIPDIEANFSDDEGELLNAMRQKQKQKISNRELQEDDLDFIFSENAIKEKQLLNQNMNKLQIKVQPSPNSILQTAQFNQHQLFSTNYNQKLQTKVQSIQPVDFNHDFLVQHLTTNSVKIDQKDSQRKNNFISHIESEMIPNSQMKKKNPRKKKNQKSLSVNKKKD